MDYMDQIERLFLEITAEYEIKNNFYHEYDEDKFQPIDDDIDFNEIDEEK